MKKDKVTLNLTEKDLIFKNFIEHSRSCRGLKLVGECNGCGKCCNPQTSYYTNLDKNTMDMVEIAKVPCIYLDPITKKCKNYEDREILCSMFPYLPENLFDGCGYHFENVEVKPLKLSVVMIVKDEEKCLERCLKSVQGADELIIVDTGSVDNTIEIAKKYTDKIFTDYKWNDNFAEARNFALSKSTGDWALSIDADEFLEPNGLIKIRKGIAFAEKYNQRTINCIMVANISGEEFLFPRLFKHCPEVYWCGAIHNHLNITDNNKSDVRITYSYSNAHELDPDRALRILKREINKNPKLIREAFYLAREYFYRKDYITASFWYKDYLTRANWAPEWSESWLMLARCYWNLDRADEAKDACLQAIKINADFQEALLFMSELCGRKNSLKWLEYAQLADSNDVLTVRKKIEKQSEYYDKLFSDSSDMSRYYHIYNRIGELVGDEKVLDIGCGLSMLRNFVKNYRGFDFSEETIKSINDDRVWVGNIYDPLNYTREDYDTYIATEVLEHLDDYKVLNNIPTGKKIIFSVPSFEDESHLRVYTEKLIHYRYDSILEIRNVTRFNWCGEWRQNGELTDNYILLIEAEKK